MSQERFNDIIPVKSTAKKPGRLERLRSWAPFVPGSFSQRRIAYDGVLRRFQNRFSLVPVALPLDGSIDDADRKHMVEAAHRLVKGNVVNREALVEVRPMLPADALRGGIGKSALTAVGVVKDSLRDSGIRGAIPNSHPILPPEVSDDDTVPAEEIWGTIGSELDSLEHQSRAERGIRNAALIAVTDPRFAHHVFAPQIVSESQFIEESRPVVLARVSDDPRDNVLAPVSV